MKISLLIFNVFFFYENNFIKIKATRFGLVVRGLGSIHELLSSILIDNIVNKKKTLLRLSSQAQAKRA
jgi:hypothetical protein